MAIPVIPEYEVSVGKSKESQDFGFHFSAKLARTLAETLYDYKIEAVVREYSTNITDSHTDAGFPEKAGLINVPTKLNPVIKFQDFGVGMSKETIFKIYTVFGKSTKEHDNTTNGSLGYGSKSAFSVSEQFTVTSIKDNIKTVVVCYKDRTGLPKADIKLEEKVNEPNGTTVEVPVKLSQVGEWQEACARVLGAFRVPHDVNTFGDYQDQYKAIKSVCEQARTEGSVFLKSPTHELTQHRSNTLVLMGDVLYHLPDFNNLIAATTITHLVKSFVRSGFYVAHFNIGDLDHAPSREAISYDMKTLTKVRRRVNSDIKKDYRAFAKDIDIGGDVSFYTFYHKYCKTSAWDVLEYLVLPFTEKNPLRNIDPRNYHTWYYNKVMLLAGKGYGKIRGIIPDGSNCGTVFSHCVQSLNQDRLLNITNPVIIYSELEKGLYKMKETITNVHEHFSNRHVLYVDSKGQAERLGKWFGAEDIICGDEYSPEKTSRKGVRGKRGGFGIKSDYETVGTYLEVTEDGYNYQTGKVDLSEEGVYWCDQDNIIVKGVVPKEETCFSTSNSTLVKMLRMIGGKKVVFKNLNNKGKIERSGIQSLSDEFSKVVKENKKDLTKYLAWKSHPLQHLSDKEELIAKTKPIFEKVNQRYEREVNVSNVVKELASLSKFNLDKTKLYGKYNSTRLSLKDKVEKEVSSTLSKLPLHHMFNCWNESETESFQYYLKLEKVIK